MGEGRESGVAGTTGEGMSHTTMAPFLLQTPNPAPMPSSYLTANCSTTASTAILSGCPSALLRVRMGWFEGNWGDADAEQQRVMDKEQVEQGDRVGVDH